jgi:hypothetical protein
MVEYVNKDYNKYLHFSLNRRLFYVLIFLFILLSIFLIVSSLININKLNTSSSIKFCGDGSFVNTCSINKPYYCDDFNQLVKNTVLCGCPENFSKSNGGCYTNYMIGEKEINLKYIFDGKEEIISFNVYDGLDSYFYS